MITKFIKYNEAFDQSLFEVGDLVKCEGEMDDILFTGQVGRITSKKPEYCTVKFDTRFNVYLHHGEDDPTETSYDIYYRYLIPIKDLAEHLKKKEEARLKHLHIDPYSEEIWDLEESRYYKKDTSLLDGKEYYFLDMKGMCDDYYYYLLQEKGAYELKKDIEKLLLEKEVEFVTDDINKIRAIVNSIEVKKEYRVIFQFDVYINGKKVFLGRRIKIFGERVFSENDPYGEEVWESVENWEEKYDLDIVFNDCWNEHAGDEENEQVAEEKINRDLKGKFIRFIDEYGKSKYGRFKDIKIDTSSAKDDMEGIDYYIWLRDNVSRTPVSYDNHIIKILDEEETDTSLSWWKNGKLEENFDQNHIEETYPFKETYDLPSICLSFASEDDFDTIRARARFNKLFLNKMVEFTDFDTKEKIIGKIEEIDIDDWFGEMYFYFVVNDQKHLIDHKNDIILYLKEERKKNINTEVDPYGEEDWDE